MAGYTRLMNASENEIADAYSAFLFGSKFFTYCNIVTEVCSDVVHWVFAMKYWVLSCQLEMLQKREDPSKSKTKFRVIFVVGVLLNLIAGVVTAL